MLEMAEQEKTELSQTLATTEQEILTLLVPADEADDRDVVLEVRAGE